MTFVITLLFMFMVFWRPQEWLVPWLYGWPLLDAVVGCALLSLAVEVNERKARIPLELPQFMLLLGLWLAAPLSHIPHTYVAGMIASISPVFNICFFTMLLIVVLDRPERIHTVAVLFVVMGLVLAIHAQMQDKLGYGFGGATPLWVPPIEDEPGYYRTQFFGIFSDPNDLAQVLVTCIPFTFCLSRRFGFMSILTGISLSWFFIDSMLTTHSRGGMVGLLATAGCRIALWFPARWFPYLFGFGVLGFLGLCSFEGPGLDTSAQDRVVFWGLANEMFKHNPLFGIGYEMAWMCTDKGLALHNAFVTCYTELGLFGYWFWFILLQLGVVGAMRTRRVLQRMRTPGSRELRFVAGQVVAAQMGFCASAFFLSRTFIFPLFFLIAMLAVIPRLAMHHLPPHHPPLLDRRRDVYFWGTIGTVMSVVYIYWTIVILNKSYYG